MTDEDRKKKEEEEKAKEKELTPDEEFDQAWDEGDEDDSTTTEEDVQQEELTAEGTPDEDDESTSQDSDNTAAEDQDDATDVETLKAQIDLLVSENKSLEHRMKSWEGRITAANKRAEQAEEKLKKAQEEQQAKAVDSLPDGEEDAVVKEFLEEFPTLEKPLKTMVKQAAEKLLQEKLSHLDQIETRVEKVEKTQVDSDTQAHAQKILDAHPDWHQIYDSGDLDEWIKEQPPLLQRTLNQVIQDGSTEDVINMFDQYKAANKTSEEKNTNSNSGRSKSKRAAAMEAVPAKTSGPPKAKPVVDQNDFDAAWDDAISTK